MTGKLISWNPRGFGQIVVRNGTELHRYYLHISNVTHLAEELEEPMLNCQVTFEVSNEPRRKPTDFPNAVNVHVGLPVAPAAKAAK